MLMITQLCLKVGVWIICIIVGRNKCSNKVINESFILTDSVSKPHSFGSQGSAGTGVQAM